MEILCGRETRMLIQGTCEKLLASARQNVNSNIFFNISILGLQMSDYKNKHTRVLLCFGFVWFLVISELLCANT